MTATRTGRSGSPRRSSSPSMTERTRSRSARPACSGWSRPRPGQVRHRDRRAPGSGLRHGGDAAGPRLRVPRAASAQRAARGARLERRGAHRVRARGLPAHRRAPRRDAEPWPARGPGADGRRAGGLRCVRARLTACSPTASPHACERPVSRLWSTGLSGCTCAAPERDATRFQVGMNACREPLRLGNAVEHRDELRPLRGAEGRQQLGLAALLRRARARPAGRGPGESGRACRRGGRRGRGAARRARDARGRRPARPRRCGGSPARGSVPAGTGPRSRRGG